MQKTEMMQQAKGTEGTFFSLEINIIWRVKSIKCIEIVCGYIDFNVLIVIEIIHLD